MRKAIGLNIKIIKKMHHPYDSSIPERLDSVNCQHPLLKARFQKIRENLRDADKEYVLT